MTTSESRHAIDHLYQLLGNLEFLIVRVIIDSIGVVNSDTIGSGLSGDSSSSSSILDEATFGEHKKQKQRSPLKDSKSKTS